MQQLAYLVDQQLDRWKRFLLNSIDQVVKCLSCQLAALVIRAETSLQSSRSTSGPKFIRPVTVWKINRLSLLEGIGNSIFRSNRPGRSRAGSRVSCRLVAMMTCSSASPFFLRDSADLDGSLLVETVHLIEEFEEDTLYFSIRSCLSIESFRSDGIDFIDKNDTRRVFACETEDISYHSWSLYVSSTVSRNRLREGNAPLLDTSARTRILPLG